MSFDRKTAIHVAAETAILGGLTVYLLNRISALEQKVAELEKDTQAVARHGVVVERKQAEAINAVSSILKTNQNPKPILKKPQEKKVLEFSDEPDEETSDEDVEETPPIKRKPRVAPKKGIKVAQVQHEGGDVRSSKKGMDGTKRQAEMLAKAAEE